MSNAINTLLKDYPEETTQLALELRSFLAARLPSEVNEHVDTSSRVIAYGRGNGYKGLLFTIILSKKGVKLGFYRGSELIDPNKLLTGSGKLHKYVLINSIRAIHDPNLDALIKAQIKKRPATE